jgi:hypothetical protein
LTRSCKASASCRPSRRKRRLCLRLTRAAGSGGSSISVSVSLDGKELLALACRRLPNVAPRILRLLFGNVFGRSFVIVVDLLLPFFSNGVGPVSGGLGLPPPIPPIWADALPLSRANAAPSNKVLLHRPLVKLFRAGDMTLDCISYYGITAAGTAPVEL